MQFYWLFIINGKYMILSDNELGDGDNLIRFQLENDGYELIWDSATSKEEAAEYARHFYGAEKHGLRMTPITFKEACNFIKDHHRHHTAPQGHKFSLAVKDDLNILGIAIAGRPVSRHNDDGDTLEVTRCCVKPQYRNLHVCSKLLAAIRRIAHEMGYKRLITYTLASESGTSLKACGFILTGISPGGSWNSSTRERTDKHPIGEKQVWEMRLGL